MELWYHLLNCGFPLKVSGETDFPCMSGPRVGQGRVYVRLGDVKLRRLRRLVRGAGRRPVVRLGRLRPRPGVHRRRQAAGRPPRAGEARDGRRAGEGRLRRPDAAGGGPRRHRPGRGPQLVGDTVNLHGPRRDGEFTAAGESRRVELVVNGRAVASREVPADDRVHELEFHVPIERSSWVALRHFPQLHTNPVDVLVGGQPIRASRRVRSWCLEAAEQLWRARGRTIAPGERDEARRAFDQAIETLSSDRVRGSRRARLVHDRGTVAQATSTSARSVLNP